MSVAPSYRTLTREKFLLRELRIVSRLRAQGIPDQEIMRRAQEDNVFQFPTERMRKNIAQVCLRRLDALNSPQLTALIADGTTEQACQGALYAVMCENRLVRDFMVQLVGAKLSALDSSLTRADVSAYLNALCQREPAVAAWSPSTLDRCRQELVRILVDAGYLASRTSDRLTAPLLDPQVEAVIVANDDSEALAAFGIRR